MLPPEVVRRAVCYRCDKPQSMCLCSRVPRVDNKTRVLVLQHPRERTHAIGTARLARIGLQNSHVEVAWNAREHEEELPAWVPSNTALLYPSPTARALETMPPAEHPQNLLVIDGTWNTARTLFRDKAWLQRLPQVRLEPSAPSRYRLRREPQADFVSTIEAIVQALQVLEPQTLGLPEMLLAFDAMIDDQLAHVLRKTETRHKRHLLEKRPVLERRTPRALLQHFDQVVMTYVESSRLDEKMPREIVQVCAVALATGASFERIVVPSAGMPSAGVLHHMKLDESHFAHSCTTDVLRDELQLFLNSCSRSPQLAAWNQGSLELLGTLLGRAPSKLALKSAYRSVFGADVQELREAVQKRELTPEPNAFNGRAHERIGDAIAIARYLHARAQGLVPETE